MMPKDVEEVAFLAKAVRHKRFQIKEAITLDSQHLWKACNQGFLKMYTFPPYDL